MKISNQELEELLRKSPKPEPPAGLLENLVRGIRLQSTPEADNRQPSIYGGPMSQNNSIRPTKWVNSWWPMAIAAGLTLACLALVAYQQVEIRRLQATLSALQVQQTTPPKTDPEPINAQPALTDRQDLERLRKAVDDLRETGTRKVVLQQENAQMRKVLDDAALDAQAAQQPPAGAFEKAQRIQCINNLKQLGLAARVWGTDHGDLTPPNILSMSNELSTPKILVCPSDTGRSVAADWLSFSIANCSYEYLSPNAPDNEPDRVLFRCKLHNAVTLCDGSVQSLQPASASSQLVVRNGVTYLGSAATPGAGMSEAMRKRYGLAPTQQDGAPAKPQMDERMMRRYGLVPPDTNATSAPVVEEGK